MRAQQPAAAPQPNATPDASTATVPAATVSLADAYKREHAFLVAQKRELSGRLGQARADFERDRARLRGDVDALESRLVAARGRSEAVSEALEKADLVEQAGAETRELLEAT